MPPTPPPSPFFLTGLLFQTSSCFAVSATAAVIFFWLNRLPLPDFLRRYLIFFSIFVHSSHVHPVCYSGLPMLRQRNPPSCLVFFLFFGSSFPGGFFTFRLSGRLLCPAVFDRLFSAQSSLVPFLSFEFQFFSSWRLGTRVGDSELGFFEVSFCRALMSSRCARFPLLLWSKIYVSSRVLVHSTFFFVTRIFFPLLLWWVTTLLTLVASDTSPRSLLFKSPFLLSQHCTLVFGPPPRCRFFLLGRRT